MGLRPHHGGRMIRLLALLAIIALLFLGGRLFSTGDWGKPRKR